MTSLESLDSTLSIAGKLVRIKAMKSSPSQSQLQSPNASFIKPMSRSQKRKRRRTPTSQKEKQNTKKTTDACVITPIKRPLIIPNPPKIDWKWLGNRREWQKMDQKIAGKMEKLVYGERVKKPIFLLIFQTFFSCISPRVPLKKIQTV